MIKPGKKLNICILCHASLDEEKPLHNFVQFSFPQLGGDMHGACKKVFDEVRAEAETKLARRYLEEARRRVNG